MAKNNALKLLLESLEYTLSANEYSMVVYSVKACTDSRYNKLVLWVFNEIYLMNKARSRYFGSGWYLATKSTGGSIAKSAKLHLLLHLGENIRRHGMPLGYSTEVFESFNKKMRTYVSQTNQKDYSHDAMIYYYQNFRTLFIENLSCRDDHFSEFTDLDQIINKKNRSIIFSKRAFAGTLSKFLTDFDEEQDIFKGFGSLVRQTLISFFPNNLLSFSYFQGIEGESARELYLEANSVFFQFIAGIAVSHSSSEEELWFLGRKMICQGELFMPEEDCLVKPLCNASLANFQHDCHSSNCSLLNEGKTHSMGGKYFHNEYFF